MKADGTTWTRVDCAPKGCGEAAYVADMRFPGLLHGRFLGSIYPHALVKRVHVDKAEGLPGVRAAVTGKDFSYVHGEALVNIPFLAVDKVRYFGEPVAAVVAEEEEIAEQALRLIKVEYEEIPAVFDPEEALGEEAPLIHEVLHTYQAPECKPVPHSNVAHRLLLRQGDVEAGLRESDYVFEGRFVSPRVQHVAIEPHACIARVDVEGHITLWSQNDSPHRARREIAEALGIPQAKVRVLTGYVGGNFGGKGGLKPEAIAIALARHVVGRPVRVVFSREEVFSNTITRVGCIVYLKTGVCRDGTIVARKVSLIWDTGAYAEKSPTVATAGASLSVGPYRIPNILVESDVVFTNKPMAGAMRGYGLPQVAFACESQMDMIAESLQMDPIILRKKNALVEGNRIITGQRLCAVGLQECLERVEQSLFREGPVPGHSFSIAGQGLSQGKWVYGKGLACIFKPVKTPSVSTAYVKIDEDGSGSVITSTVEVGQGAHTILLQIAAAVLGLPQDRLTISFADTDVTPYDTSTTSSRSTFYMGNAVRMAAEDAKQQILALAAPILGCDAGDLQTVDGQIIAPDGKSISLPELLKETFRSGGGILGRGVFTARDPLADPQFPLKKFSAFHGYAVQGAEVAVNLETGEVKVLRMVAAHDVGKVINRLNCQQQIEGALVMGMGYAIMEEYLWNDGRMLNPDLLNYRIPTVLDNIPDMETILVEKPHPEGPFGAKGLGEMATTPTAAAIANAVYNACGVRVYELPITPAKVIAALRKNQEGI